MRARDRHEKPRKIIIRTRWPLRTSFVLGHSSQRLKGKAAMRDISRRTFLKSSSAALVAAGTISALPAAPAVLNALESQGPADTGAAESATAEVATASESVGAPLIAHVQETGEIAIYAGTREITLIDPQLAARLARAIG